MAPAERADVVFDFSAHAGEKLLLSSDSFDLMEFRVAANPEAHRVDVVATPAPVNLSIENHIRFVDGRCGGGAGRVDFQVASTAWDRVVFNGALSARCTEQSFARVLLRPTTYAFGTFVELWRQSGGEFKMPTTDMPRAFVSVYVCSPFGAPWLARLTVTTSVPSKRPGPSPAVSADETSVPVALKPTVRGASR